ncbi:TIGR02391 family protein [Haloarcula sp. CGMCC 1.2071]|uniref:TIGR02391 family protein n=1 Tax=Haloarcula sp. CGMCC 1.2071 TaxID=3111454 RepID=UPI00300F709E
MVDVSSLVVSDPIAHKASNSAIEKSGEGDIVYCDWENYLTHTFEQTVQVFDYNLWVHASETTRGSGSYEISENKDIFEPFFNSFADDIRYALKSGDVVVVLNGTEFPLQNKSFSGKNTEISSHQWLRDLSVFDDWHYVNDCSPNVLSDSDPVSAYFNSVANHFSFTLNRNVVENFEILATSPSASLPAGVAINDVLDHHGNKIQTKGTLVILPTPTAVPKPYELMRTLVNLGWSFHENSRSKSATDAPEDKTSLSIPMNQLDDQLIEVSWTKYARGEYRDAAARACQHLEHRVRNSVHSEYQNKDGSDLMKHSFSPQGGPLSMGERPGEREGVMHLFAGAIQGIWNPLHHRPTSDTENKYLDEFGQQEAHDVISYVNFLLSLLPEEQNSASEE